MVIIGLVLLGLAIAAGVDIAAQNHGESLHIHAAGQTFTATPGSMVAIGAVCAIVGVVGIMLVHDGAVRRRQLRIDARSARAERDELAAQMERERGARVEADERGRAVASSDAGGTGIMSGSGRSDLVDLSDSAEAPPARTGWLHRTH